MKRAWELLLGVGWMFIFVTLLVLFPRVVIMLQDGFKNSSFFIITLAYFCLLFYIAGVKVIDMFNHAGVERSFFSPEVIRGFAIALIASGLVTYFSNPFNQYTVYVSMGIFFGGVIMMFVSKIQQDQLDEEKTQRSVRRTNTIARKVVKKVSRRKPVSKKKGKRK